MLFVYFFFLQFWVYVEFGAFGGTHVFHWNEELFHSKENNDQEEGFQNKDCLSLRGHSFVLLIKVVVDATLYCLILFVLFLVHLCNV